MKLFGWGGGGDIIYCLWDNNSLNTLGNEPRFNECSKAINNISKYFSNAGMTQSDPRASRGY